jgi:hypothetical protein
VVEIELGLRIMLSGVFLVAITKLRSRRERAAFLAQVRSLSHAPARPALALAVAVACGEITAIPLLAVPRWADAGFALATVLCCGYLAGTAVAVHRGHTAPCRCFGFGAAPMGRAHLWRNGLVLAAGLTGLLLPDGAAPTGAGVVVAALGGTAGAVVAVLFTEFVSLFTGGSRAAAATPALAHASVRTVPRRAPVRDGH